MIKFSLISSLCLFLVSCASNSKSGSLNKYKIKMTLQDKSGEFDYAREAGLAKNKKEYVTKYRVYSRGGSERKVLEQSIAFSTPGVLADKVKVMRPVKSQYKVWFDAKLYQTETFVDIKKKSLVVTMKSPEQQWSGKKSFVFPGGNGVFCYFSQLFECISYTGFVDKAISSRAGKMNFHVIWDGYPYFQEQYLNIAPGPFAAAEIEYDGEAKDGEYRFSVSVSGNAIFYLYNDTKDYAKMFWPAQGFSLYHK